jgi:hypothetical protein
LDGPVGGGHARPDVSHRHVFVRAAIRHEVAERAPPRLNRLLANRSGIPVFRR